MMRRDDLCPGPTECPYIEEARPTLDTPRCDDCPVTKLDAYLDSGAGQWIQATIDLDFALQAGVTIGLGDIGYPEFLLLRVLSEERNRYQEDEVNRIRRGR